ncbi:Dullard family phosphatase domain-containing protein [Besnoitia besnoiti]|uniref:Dullard family phosphatase domain-containing protein n=1 Tax=Besnoitia besnoiti TaxID=94643 RepID=A0A2A9M4H7_BESBE|nr:Dullard family phosphatase domain-containing protein [Besnoitia besnoiti]PFH32849.1 Dullard family phosphatase domain-containing protein [Besnoitia besnoiti]
MVSSLARALLDGAPAGQTAARLFLCVLLVLLFLRFSLHRHFARTLSSLLHPRPRHYIRAHLAALAGACPASSSASPWFASFFPHLPASGRSAPPGASSLLDRGRGGGAGGLRQAPERKRAAGARGGDARRRGELPTTLVIDLDETLVLATKTRLSPEQLAVDVSIQGKLSTFYVAKRPFAEVFLAELFPLFQIVIFTAGRHEYANAILDNLDLQPYVDRCYTREDCRLVGPNLYAKDLQKVCSDLSRTVLIDDSPVAALYFPDNYIPIEGWCGSAADTALLDLLPLLLALRSVRDVRTVLQLRHQTNPPEQRRQAAHQPNSAFLSLSPPQSPAGLFRYLPSFPSSLFSPFAFSSKRSRSAFSLPSVSSLASPTPAAHASPSASSLVAAPASPLALQPPALSASVLAACRSTMRAGFVSGVYAPLHHVHVSIHQRVRSLAQGVQGCVCQSARHAAAGRQSDEPRPREDEGSSETGEKPREKDDRRARKDERRENYDRGEGREKRGDTDAEGGGRRRRQ